MNRLHHWILTSLILAGFTLTNSGCQDAKSVAKSTAVPKAKESHDHDHPEKGPHGGELVEWGEEDYHIEVTFDHKNKQAVIYLLDSTARNAANVETDKVKVTLKISNTQPPITLLLQHDAAKSSDKGLAFVG